MQGRVNTEILRGKAQGGHALEHRVGCINGATTRNIERIKKDIEELNEDDANRLESKLASDYLEARQKFQDKNYLEALQKYNFLITIKPNEPDYRFERGLVLFELERYDDAFKEFKKTTELKPKFEKAWFNMGIVEYNSPTGSLEKAIELFDNAIRLKSNYELALLNRAFALCDLANSKEENEATELYRRAEVTITSLLRQYPENMDAQILKMRMIEASVWLG